MKEDFALRSLRDVMKKVKQLAMPISQLTKQ